MDTFLLEQALESEFSDDVIGPEECVDRFRKRVCSVLLRISVYDLYVLEDQGREWLEVDLLELYVSVQLVIQLVHNLPGYKSLHLRELNGQDSCNDD